MKERGGATLLAGLVLAGLVLVAALPAGDFAAPFFRAGEAPRAIEARLEGSSASFDASLFACSGCHGTSGEGRREGGTLAADIRFSRLSAAGRYDEKLFCRALVEGIDPQSAELARAMPRYGLEEGECDALWRYLRRLEEELPPGISEKEIAIGVASRRMNPARLAWQEALRQELESFNQQGGFFGRRFRLVGSEELAAIRILIDGELPAPGDYAEELLISVPPPRQASKSWELWQVEAGREQQLALIAADAPSWQVLRGQSEEAEQVYTLFEDAAIDAEVKIDEAPPSCGGSQDVLLLAADASTLAAARRLDVCPGPRRFLLFEPRLPLEDFESLEHAYFLVVPFDPGAERDLNAGARRLAKTLAKTFDRAGRRLRLPRLIEELSSSFAEEGGGGRALYAGILLLPRGEKEPPRWLGAR